MTATSWKKGDRVSLTTTTAGAELLEIVTFVRRKSGAQFVVLAPPSTASAIRAGSVDFRVAVLTGCARVREVETQRFHRLTAAGRAVPVA